MLALDLLGAGEGLSTQVIMLRVQKIDVPKLRKSLGEVSWGAALSPALNIVDQYPQMAVDFALPLAKQKLEDSGITADLSATNAPPPARPPAESKAALVLGTGVGLVLAFAVQKLYHRVTRKGS